MFINIKIYSLLLLTLFLFSTSAAVVAPVTETNKIVKIASIQEIQTSYPKKTIIFFDLDDTLFDSPYMLGSKAWRKYISQVTKDSKKNWHDIFSLFVARNLKVTPIEPATNQLINELQRQGYGVCGLTARERQIWYDTPTQGIDVLTIKQLDIAGIHFDGEAFKKMYPGLAQDPEFYEGVFFADTDSKGEYLRKILERSSPSERPKKIVFIDDKLSQVESVASALKQLHIDYECYWYYATDEKAKKFNPLIANIQLYYLWQTNGCEVLSDQEAEKIAQQSPEKDPEYYLKAILN